MHNILIPSFLFSNPCLDVSCCQFFAIANHLNIIHFLDVVNIVITIILSLWTRPNFPLVNDGRMDEPPHTRVLLTKVRCQKKHKAMLFPMVLMAPVKHPQREQNKTRCRLRGFGLSWRSKFFFVPRVKVRWAKVLSLSCNG